MSKKAQKIDKATLAILNHTDNLALKAYREIYRKYSWILIFYDVIILFYRILIANLAGNNITLSYQRRNALDKYWLISILNQYRQDLILAEGLGKKVPLKSYSSIFPIDSKIARAIFTLNSLGIITHYCCEGDQEKGHSYSSYISLGYNMHFPDSLIEKLDTLHVPYRLSPQKPDEDNPYHNGPALYSQSTKTLSMNDANITLLSALEQWSNDHNTPSLHILKNKWKY